MTISTSLAIWCPQFHYLQHAKHLGVLRHQLTGQAAEFGAEGQNHLRVQKRKRFAYDTSIGMDSSRDCPPEAEGLSKGPDTPATAFM